MSKLNKLCSSTKNQSVFCSLLFFLLAVVANVYAGTAVDEKLLELNCFPYETDFYNFREEEVTEELLGLFSDGNEEDNFQQLSEYLTMYFALDKTNSNPKLLEENIAFVKEHQPEKFYSIQEKIKAMWTDAVLFPVGTIENEPDAAVFFGNSWAESRTFGGDRVHEGCDIMASVNERGIYPIYSASDGVVEKIGWLRLGGYRIGIRSEHGVYFYYAHLSEYARQFEAGETVKAGTLLGFMGDTGYSDIEGTTGKFPVHLHFGIYFNDENGKEFSVNPYPLLKYLYSEEEGVTETDAADNLPDE